MSILVSIKVSQRRSTKIDGMCKMYRTKIAPKNASDGTSGQADIKKALLTPSFGKNCVKIKVKQTTPFEVI